MTKDTLSINITEFRRQLSVKRLMLWLQNYTKINIYQGDDVICEIHPHGTGYTLALLKLERETKEQKA